MCKIVCIKRIRHHTLQEKITWVDAKLSKSKWETRKLCFWFTSKLPSNSSHCCIFVHREGNFYLFLRFIICILKCGNNFVANIILILILVWLFSLKLRLITIIFTTVLNMELWRGFEFFVHGFTTGLLIYFYMVIQHTNG